MDAWSATPTGCESRVPRRRSHRRLAARAGDRDRARRGDVVAGRRNRGAAGSATRSGFRTPRRRCSRCPPREACSCPGAGGTWTVAADGSSRRLGPWRQASWSPHGLFVAVTRERRARRGGPARHASLGARPTGCAATRAGMSRRAIGSRTCRPHTLRVVAGDGTGDHAARHRRRVDRAGVAAGQQLPAGLRHRDGTLVVRDADSKRMIWTAPLSGPARELSWSSDGRELLVVTATRASLYDAGGHTVATIPARRARRSATASLAPDGTRSRWSAGPPTRTSVVLNVGSPDAPQPAACCRAPVCASSRGRPTAGGCWSAGPPPISGCSSGSPACRGSPPSRASRASSPRARRRMRSRALRGGVALRAGTRAEAPASAETSRTRNTLLASSIEKVLITTGASVTVCPGGHGPRHEAERRRPVEGVKRWEPCTNEANPAS